ncbi:sensor domain-containing diguanylate cyclase [Rhodoferax sp.]|uniref:GGDEF domain-containing protein n=1 Tax=Rhodoferax sp. TaxID=50421 RepID=UPI00284D1B72|nr:sensor domain-containing diguanylate cyclase [Rhodoferax sp.]MDR3370179.1 sensor domain-containing diguanylate cyclase [Rhodoferax sp.]
MSEPGAPTATSEAEALRGEIARKNKIIRSLMDRAERSTSVEGTDFTLFQSAVVLEEQVRSRTKKLEAALHENEKITYALRESELKFHGLVNQSLVGIAIIEDGKFSYTNAKFHEIFGYSADEVRGMAVLDTAIEQERSMIAEKIRQRLKNKVAPSNYVFHGLRRDGVVIDVEVYSSTMEHNGKLALISLIMDVTERTRTERKVQDLQKSLLHQSTHDVLTGLYNRRYMEETLVREIVAARRHGHPVSVIMSDLDHFKLVNDRYGHLAGDEVLRVFGALLTKHARGSDVCCRYGGEEVLLVLPQMSKGNAIERAELLCNALAAEPVTCGTSLIAVTASFGVATFPQDGRTVDALIAAADSALYAAKKAGRNRVNASAPG